MCFALAIDHLDVYIICMWMCGCVGVRICGCADVLRCICMHASSVVCVIGGWVRKCKYVNIYMSREREMLIPSMDERMSGSS